MNYNKYKIYHPFFRNLANPLRVNIILSLREKKKNVTELSHQLKVEQSKISHALAALRECNMVKVERKGKQRIYYLNKETIIPMLKIIDKHVKSFCKKSQSCRECKIKL